MEAKQDFDRASRLVKTEVARFEQERVEDFRDSLQAFLNGMIDRQKEVRVPMSSFHATIDSWITANRCMGRLPASLAEESYSSSLHFATPERRRNHHELILYF